MNVAVLIALHLGISSQVVGLCTFPEEWNGLWYDSRKTDVTLNRNSSAVQSGWTLQAYSSSVTSWTCVEQSTDTYLIKGDQDVDVFGSPHAAYLCLAVTKVTSVSYRYTIVADEQVNAGGERVSIISTARNATIAMDCTATSPPGLEEYHVLIKADNVSDVKQYFPEPLLAILYNSNYTKTDPTCDSDVILDMCSDRAIMNRTECSAGSGQVLDRLYYCVTYVQDGSQYFVSLLNPEVTGSNQQHFICLAVTKLNNQIFISDNNGSCAKSQDPQALQANGTETLVMFTNVLCPFVTNPSEDDVDVDVGLIVGSLIAGLVFLAIIIAACICCLRKKYRDKIWKFFQTKCQRKIQQKDVQASKLFMEKKSSTNEANGDTESESKSSSVLIDDCKRTKDFSNVGLTNSENDGDHQDSGSLNSVTMTTPVEFLDDTKGDIETGRAPVDERKGSRAVVDHAVSMNEIEDEDRNFQIKNTCEGKPEFHRQTTEDDMEQLRKINKQVNFEKHLFKKENIPLDSEMTASERIYFEKSVFANQNVEAEMYLNETLESSLPIIVEAQDDKDIPELELESITSSPIHATGFVSQYQQQPMSPIEDNEDSGKIQGMVIEELEFSLTEEQITARSSLSVALSSRLSSRKVSTAETIAKGLRESLSPPKRSFGKMKKRRAPSRSSFHSAPELGSKSDTYPRLSSSATPVIKRTSSKMSRLKIATLKRKRQEFNTVSRPPKMKFRWI